MVMASKNNSNARQQRSGSTATTKQTAQSSPAAPTNQISVQESKRTKQRDKSCVVDTKTATATAAAQPPSRRKVVKHKSSKSKCKTMAPLELIVVGHRLNIMRPIHMPPVAVTQTQTAANSQKVRQTSARAEAKPGAMKPGPVSLNSQLPLHILEDGEFLYIYESCPLQLLQTQLDTPNELKLAPQREFLPLSIVEQVLDTRFFAELFDQLLTCDE